MEIHQLRYFLSIVETGAFTKAADACHVSQPSLSAQIAKLEDELGGPLFERSRQGSKLTVRGEVFKARAAEMIRHMEAVRKDMDALDGLAKGEVTLGCLPTTGAYLLPKLLKGFRENYPTIHIHLREESSPTLRQLLQESNVDLAILDEAGLGDRMESQLLFSESLFVAVPEGHRFAGRLSMPLSDLEGEPLILMKTGHGFRKIVVDALERARVNPHVVYESGGIDTVQSLVEAGLGISVVPKMVMKSPGPRYIAIDEPTPSRSLFLARREGAVLSPAALEFQKFAVELFALS